MGRRTRCCLVICFALCVLSARGAAWIPCDSAGPFTLDSPTSRIVYSGETIYLFPIENGVVHSTINATISLTGVQEWSTYDAYTYGCYEPSTPQPPGIDYPTDGTGPFGHSYGALITAQMECNVVKVNETIPGTDIWEETIFIQARNLSVSNATIIFNISRPYGDYTEVYPGGDFTNGVDYIIRYMSDSFKVSLEINDWDWTGPNGTTHLVVYLASYMHIDGPAIMFWGQEPGMKNVTNWNCTLLDANGHGYLTMFVELDHGFLLYDKLDNGELAPAVPWMNIIGHETYGPWQWYPSLPAFGGTFSNSFCQHYDAPYQYARLYWDPQLSVLFDGASSIDNPAAPPQVLNPSNRLLALYIVVPVCAVVILLIIGAYFAFPSLQRAIRPYKESEGSGLGSNTVLRENKPSENARWSRGGPSDRDSYIQ